MTEQKILIHESFFRERNAKKTRTPKLSPLDRLTEPTLQRLRRKKIQTNICQVFILHSAWGFISRPPKGRTSAPSSSRHLLVKVQSERSC